jgi:hypothetical protein
VQDQEGAIEFDLFDLDIGDRGSEHRASVGFLADLADEALHNLASDPAAFHFGEVDFVALSELADRAYVVGIIPTTEQKRNFFLRADDVEETRVESGEIYSPETFTRL